MKKLLLLSLFTLSGFITNAQFWLDLGIKGGAGPTFLVNKNMMNDRLVEPVLTIGYGYGGKLGLNFNDNHELTFDVMLNKLNQEYSITDTVIKPKTFWTKNLSLSTLDLALLYRFHKNGTYFEIGPQYSMVRKVSQSNIVTNTTTDAKSYIASSYYSGILGFGSDFIGSQNFSFLIGFRFAYSLSDLLSEAGGKGKPYSFPVNDFMKDRSYAVLYDSYTPFKALTAMLIMEFNFDMGYFAKSNCKKKRVRFFTF